MGIFFRYQAKDKNAQYKDGIVEAIDKDDALSKLEQEGLYVFSIERIEDKKVKPAPSSGGYKKENNKILLIEDSAFILQLLKYILEKNGYEVASSPTANDGLSKAEKEKPDLILLDIVLPDKDGLSVLRELKGADVTREIPVVMLSSKSETDVLLECKKLGADDYIIKGSKDEELLRIVRRYCY